MENPKRIRTLRINFDGELAGHEIPAFRGAIAEKAGLENILFHNHLGKDSYSYRYPLIQYKNIGGKPGIICIEQGVDQVHHFFQQKDWSLTISGRKLNMSIENLNLNQFTMQVWDKLFHYKLYNWIALNQNNYKRFMEIQDDEERVAMLTAILKGNILSFAKGIAWQVEKPIEVFIDKGFTYRPTKLKGNKVMAFRLTFKTNVFLPNLIGLGKGVSFGFGVVSSIKRKNEDEKIMNQKTDNNGE